MAAEILRQGLDILGSDGKNSPLKGLTEGIFGKIMESIGLKNPETAREATAAKETAQKERASIFGEIGKSLFLRQFPRLSALTDIGKQLSGKKDAEVVPWQHEFETISAFLILIPNKWKHHITDIFANSDTFKKLIEYWPGLDSTNLPIVGALLDKDLPIIGRGGSLRDRILKEKDPDAVIQALRIMHQDLFVTGKITFDWIKEKLGNKAIALGIVGAGAAALTAGSKLAKGNNPLEAISGDSKPKSQKLSELTKSHPEIPQTNMQKNLSKLLQKMKVWDSAELVKGQWSENNDEVTVSFLHNNNKYFLIFDNDSSSTDLILNNSNGQQINKFTDWGTLDIDNDAQDLLTSIQKPQPPETSTVPTPKTT